MVKRIIGWDVGGAHLKAVMLQANLQKKGQIESILQVPCALWRGLHELEAGIDEVMRNFSSAELLANKTLHAITMTGELVDLFESREQGVKAISDVMNRRLIGTKLFYAGRSAPGVKPNFVSIDNVALHWQHIASANWLASATYMADQLNKLGRTDSVLLIDMGSTTTDFIAIKNGRPICMAFTDATRMQAEELVYSGVIRTPLMALTHKVLFKGQLTSIAAEYFATMADVYRLTGDLLETDDMADTADGKEKTLLASARRLARMIGHDFEDASLEVWKTLAFEFKRIQLARVTEVAKLHITRMEIPSSQTVRILGAGAGSFLVKEVAAALELAYEDSTFLFKTLSPKTANTQDIGHWANVCLPAYAVAYLALHNL